MSIAAEYSLFNGKRYGIQRTCRIWDVARSTVYAGNRKGLPSAGKRGPKPCLSDEDILAAIKHDLDRTPFTGEGHRKVHARLRVLDGIRVGPQRVLRIMREHRLLSPYRVPNGPVKEHKGTITTNSPNVMWGTDGARATTVEDGNVWIFPALDHFNSECVGCHVTKYGSRYAALEPIKQGLEKYNGGASKNCAQGLSLRMDHGTQYLSDHFRNEIRFWGIAPSYAFLKEPETNGISERFIRTFKEQVLYGRIYQNIKELTDAVNNFVAIYNSQWRLERLGFLTPLEARKNYYLTQAA